MTKWLNWLKKKMLGIRQFKIKKKNELNINIRKQKQCLK